MNNLILWDRAKQAIEEARTVDEVKDIRDKAEAFRMYAKQAHESLELQNKIAEIKLRCERRIGEMTREMPKAQGARTDLTSSHDVTKKKALKDAGFNKMQASRFEAIASLPEETFEAHVARVKANNEELTTVGMAKLARKMDKEEDEHKHRWVCTTCGQRR